MLHCKSMMRVQVKRQLVTCIVHLQCMFCLSVTQFSLKICLQWNRAYVGRRFQFTSLLNDYFATIRYKCSSSDSTWTQTFFICQSLNISSCDKGKKYFKHFFWVYCSRSLNFYDFWNVFKYWQVFLHKGTQLKFRQGNGYNFAYC